MEDDDSKSDSSDMLEEKSNELRQEIEKYKEEKTRLAENLEKDASSILNDVTNFSEDAKNEQSRYKETVDNITSSLDNFKNETNEFIQTSRDVFDDNLKKIKHISSRVIKALSFTLIVFSVLFFGLYFYLNGLIIDEGAIVGFAIIIVLLVIIIITSKSFSNQIQEVQREGDRKVNDIQNKSPEIQKDYLKTGNFFESFEKSAIIFDSKIRGIVKFGRELFPLADKLSSALERHHNQVNFRRTLQNALLSYRIPLGDPKVGNYFNNFSSMSNLESDWLESASVVLTAFININPRITKLCYFDYTNDLKHLPDVWHEIVEDKVVLTQFARILLHNTMGQKQSENYNAFVELVEKIEPFRLTDFEKAYYNFFVVFKRKKTHLKTSIKQMGFDVEDIESEIDEFMPTSLLEDIWEEDLLKHVSSKLGIGHSLLMLFYFDRTGAYRKRKEVWSEILENKEKFDEFVRVLISKGILKIPEHYEDSADLLRKIREIEGEQSEFDFFKMKHSIYSKFKSIDDEKDSIMQALQDYKILFDSQKSNKEFKSFIPFSNDILTEISKDLGTRLKLDPSFILLFYGTKYDKSITEKVFAEIRNNKTKELADILIDKQLIKIETGSDPTKETDNVSMILNAIKEFNLVQIQNWYQSYVHFLEIARRITQFLFNEKLIKSHEVNFKQIMEIVPNPSGDRLTNIMSISSFFLNKEKIFTDSHLEPTSNACTCLFLFNQEDISARRGGQIIQQSELSSKILYHNMKMKETERLKTKKEYPLVEVINEVLTKTDLQFPHLAEFRMGLSNGHLFRSTTEMMSKKLEDVKNEIKKEKELQEEIKKMESSVRTFLNAELEKAPAFLEYAIQSQLVQAYVITSKSKGGPVFTELLGGETMQKIAKDVLDENESLEDFLIIGAPKEDQTVGRWTRIGVVPFNMDFDDFCDKFENLLDRTVEEFIRERNDLNMKKSDIALNIFRMLATPTTFRRIRLDGTLATDLDDPIKIIKDLIVNKFSVEDSFSLVATSKEQEHGGISFKKLAEKLFDQQVTPIHSLLKDDLRLLSNREEIDKIMIKESFNKKIYEKFAVTKFTDLTRGIHSGSENMKDEIKDVITKRVDEVFGELGLKLDEKDSMLIADVMLRKLSNLGRIFSF